MSTMKACAKCGTREDGRRYFITGTEGPVVCEEHAVAGMRRCDFPHTDIEQRITELEARVKELESQR